MYQLRLSCTALIVLLCFSQNAGAQQTPLSGSLGTWLKQSAAPELTQILANHPKFKGQSLRFAAIQNGKPVSASNGLVEAVTQVLSHNILRNGNNDIVATVKGQHCHVVINPAPYLVGVDIQPQGKSQHRVHLAVLDTHEQIWVAGVSLSWNGRLLSSEKSALARSVNTSPPGSLLNPITLTDHQQLANALYTQMRCALPQGVSGALFINIQSQPNPNQIQLEMITAALHQQLASAPGFVITPQRHGAHWQLDVMLTSTGLETHQVGITLTPLGTGLAQPIEHSHSQAASAQKVAAVYVNSVADHIRPSTQSPIQYAVRPPLGEAPALLSTPFMQPGEHNCGNNRTCAEVAFELRDHAYVAVFETRNGSLTPLKCSRKALPKRSPGTQKYRINLPYQDPTARVGFYVLATQDKTVAQALNRQLFQAPQACADSNSQSRAAWLKSTLQLVQKYQDTLSWRTLYLHSTPNGPQLL